MLQEFLDTFYANHMYLNGDEDAEGIVDLEELLIIMKVFLVLLKMMTYLKKLFIMFGKLMMDKTINLISELRIIMLIMKILKKLKIICLLIIIIKMVI